MTYQASLFRLSEPEAKAEPALGRLRKCVSCANLETPESRELAAMGLWHCKLDGVATVRSVRIASGEFRECEKGLRDAHD